DLVVAVAVEVADGQAGDRTQAVEGQVGAGEELAAGQSLEEGHGAVPVAHGQVRQAGGGESAGDDGDPHAAPPAVAVGAAEGDVALAQVDEDLVGPRRDGDQVGVEILVEQRGGGLDVAAAGRGELAGGVGGEGLGEGEVAVAVAAEDRDGVGALDGEVA